MKISFFKLTSINSRIILGVIAVVSSFMILTGFTLSKTFYNSAYSALEDRLTGQVYLLMADREIIPPVQQIKSTVFSSGSVYSQISGYVTLADGTILWQSGPDIEMMIPPTLPFIDGKQAHGKKTFQKYQVNGRPYIGLSIAIYWDINNPRFPLIYHISDDLTHLNEQISDYQYSLWSNLLLMSLVLFTTLFLILRWGLKPLRDVEQEIKAVEQGEQEKLKKTYPDEIVPLTHNINQLIQYERQHQLRYRNALADLAHSLKTPLAIIRGEIFSCKQIPETTLETASETATKTISKQTEVNYKNINDAVERMNSIIEYQLQRASSNSPSPHIQYLKLTPVVEILLNSMKKIYQDKPITVGLSIEKDVQFKIDQGDFMEVLGNLLDNAYKWCQKQINLTISLHETELHILISDDGPGIAPEMISEITKRGVRADELTPGHGVGLAIIQDIVNAYNGKINFSASSNGGLEVEILFQV